MKAGKVSYEKDDRGKVHFDKAELIRVYGEFQSDTPTDISSEQSMNGHHTYQQG